MFRCLVFLLVITASVTCSKNEEPPPPNVRMCECANVQILYMVQQNYFRPIDFNLQLVKDVSPKEFAHSHICTLVYWLFDKLFSGFFVNRNIVCVQVIG